MTNFSLYGLKEPKLEPDFYYSKFTETRTRQEISERQATIRLWQSELVKEEMKPIGANDSVMLEWIPLKLEVLNKECELFYNHLDNLAPKYSLDCDYYEKEFKTIEELINDVIQTGMDPNYSITKGGKKIGQELVDLIQF